ncbi:MAG: hypothetical protein Q9M13_07020, partial [Mariprofundales bacterium]|nr:hypothetical protein [Mariprofundales bacterium]
EKNAFFLKKIIFSVYWQMKGKASNYYLPSKKNKLPDPLRIQDLRLKTAKGLLRITSFMPKTYLY